MSYKIDFFDSFRCIGNDCKNTCCKGWNISIDKKTFEYYQSQQGDFADYVKNNIGQSGEEYYIMLTKKGICPFLDEIGLCQIYKEYGSEHQGKTCALFPRIYCSINGEIMFFLLCHGCEEVLRQICEHQGQIYLIKDRNSNNVCLENKLAEFMSFCLDIIQDESIPLGLSLGTMLYLCTENDSIQFESGAVLDVPDEKTIMCLLEEFASVKNSVSQGELERTAWEIIFCIADTFCNIISQTDLRSKESVLWDDKLFEMSEYGRKRYVQKAWAKNRKSTDAELGEKRRLFASYFSTCLLLSNKPDFCQIILERVCNYIILSELLPCTWEIDNKEQYFSKLAELGRVFEQTTAINKYVNPVIQEKLHPDIYTYILAFIFLF